MIVLLEAATLAGLLAALFKFAVGSDADLLTFVMVGLVAIVWLTFTVTAWRRPPNPVDEQRPLAEWLLGRARLAVLPVVGQDRLTQGAAAALVAEAAERPDWRLPGWLSTGQAVLVSLGLVGTFLGLTWGLIHAFPSLTIDPKDVPEGTTPAEVQMEGMRALLLGAQLAFVKSLAGVWCGMLWGLRYRQLEERHADELSGWSDWLEEQFPSISTAQLLAQALVQGAEQHRVLVDRLTETAGRITTLDRGLRTDLDRVRAELLSALGTADGTFKTIGLEIVGAIGQVGKTQTTRLLEGAREVVQTQITGQTAALVPEVRQASTDLQDQIAQLAESLPSRIGANTGTVLQPHFEELARSLKQLSDAGGSAIGSALEASMAGETGRLRQSLAEVAGLLEQLGPRVTAQMDAADRRVQEGASQAATALAEAGEVASRQLQGAASQFSAETSGIQAAMGAVRDTLAETHQVARALRGAGQEVTTGLQGVAQELSVLPPVLDRARTALDASGAALASGTEGTRAVAAQSERAAVVLQRLVPAYETLLDRSERLTAEVDRVRGASDALASTLAAMTAGQQSASAESFRALSETAARFGSALEQAQANVARASQTTFDDARSVTGDAVRQLAEVLSTGSARLEEAVRKLAAYGVELDRGLEAARVTIGAIDERAQALQVSAQAVSAPFGEVAKALERVGPEVRQASDAVQAERNALTGLGRQLEEHGQQLNRAGGEFAARIREQQALQLLLSKEWAQHVQGVEGLLIKIRAGWGEAIQAANVGVEKNAKEIGEYARAVENSLRLPRDLARLSDTIEELNDVLSDLATHVKANP